MSGIKDYSTTPADNNAAPPNGAPEGMSPGSVNDTMRQLMADTREFYEGIEFRDWGQPPSYVSSTSFTVAGDQTAIYTVGRRVKLYGSGTMLTLYGTITASVYTSLTTITVSLDSGAIDSSLSIVSVGFDPSHSPLLTVDGSITAAKLATGAVQTAKIADDAVTFAKMQNVSATSRILGRKTASAGDAEECTLSEILDFIGSAAQGDILYRGASAWTRLAAGTAGQVLQTQGAGANPQWAAGSKFKKIHIATKTDTQTSTSASWTDITGLSITLTPLSTSSKFLVYAQVSGSVSDGNSVGGLRLVRDSTVLLQGDAASNRIRVGFSLPGIFSDGIASSTGLANDAPATASSTVYKVQMNSIRSGTVCINRSSSDQDSSTIGARAASSLVILEYED